MSAATKQKPNAQRRVWRDNIEAVTMAIIMAVMLKYFIVEAYKIPTGSMQPTLMGNADTGTYDRIIVDKLSYHYRDPERFEVVVFKYPLDRSKNFIKRLCGMPGEDLLIRDGDLWTRKDASENWKILRRPLPVQREVWKRLYKKDQRFASWKPNADARTWAIDGRHTIAARGSGTVTMPNDSGAVFDNYVDGYPGDMADQLLEARHYPGTRPVGDLRVDGTISALAGCTSVSAVLREGARSYRFEIPGPAAAADAHPRIVAKSLPSATGSDAQTSANAANAWRLPAGKKVSFGAQNMDDMLTLEIDGEIVAELEIPTATDQSSSIQLAVEGEGADLGDVEIYRDIFYTEGRRHEFSIGPGQYIMLGDNTQSSSDSRDWNFAKFSWPESEGAIVRGNERSQNNENPTVVTGDPAGSRIFFRDEWGELHTFMARSATKGQIEAAPFVARNLIVGRAVIVFWPMVPSLNVWRLKWIH